MHRLIRRRGHDSGRTRGQSLVELALIAPVILLLLLTALDFGRLLYSQITVTNAAKEGALVASQGGTFQDGQPCSDTNTIMCGVLTEALDGFVEVDRALVVVEPALCDKNAMYPAAGAPPNVSVSVQAPFRILTPIIGDIVGSNVMLSATADAQCMVVPRVTYPAIPAPEAIFTANPTTGTAPLEVDFDGSASTSSGATITDWSWNFGVSGPDPTVSFDFPAGTHKVRLTVTDSRGKTDISAEQTITVVPGGGGGGPTCPTVDFVATPKAPGDSKHRVNLDATVSDGSGSWTWTWSGDIDETGQNLNNVEFPSAGPHSVTLTATKGSCAPTITKVVDAP